jgi:hypothetical protein
MEHATIPGPPGLPIIGNISDIDATNPIQSLSNLTKQYGKSLAWTSLNNKSTAALHEQRRCTHSTLN